MTIQQFIFSNKRRVRMVRHLVFWVVYIAFFYLQGVTPEVVETLYHANAFYFAWVSVCCFVPACIAAVYIFIYVLLPLLLQRGRYTLFAASVVLLYGGIAAINYHMARLFFSISCHCDISNMGFIEFFGLGNNNTFLAIAIGCLATGIKFAKEWYLQRKHVLQLANENSRAELRALKTTIHTHFLFQSLGSLEKSIAGSAAQAPGMVLQLADILSYMLYDCNADEVPLTKELAAVRQYIALQKESCKDHCTIELKTYGNAEEKLIVPAVLLSFLQNCFSLLMHTGKESTAVFIEIGTDDSKLHFLLSAHGYNQGMMAGEWSDVFAALQLRLNKFYPGKHLLEVLPATEELLVEFSVILPAIRKQEMVTKEPIQTKAHEVI